MLTCRLIFRGERQDEFGTPIPYHSYALHASSAEGGFANATATPLSQSTPMPSLATLGRKGDERDVIEALVKVLRDLQGNADLIEERTYDSGLV